MLSIMLEGDHVAWETWQIQWNRHNRLTNSVRKHKKPKHICIDEHAMPEMTIYTTLNVACMEICKKYCYRNDKHMC